VSSTTTSRRIGSVGASVLSVVPTVEREAVSVTAVHHLMSEAKQMAEGWCCLFYE
jgi:hypothetical protein